MPILKISDSDSVRLLSAVLSDGNRLHNRADAHHNAGNFVLRDGFREEADALYALAYDLRKQAKGGN